jgi:hypothetical protein
MFIALPLSFQFLVCGFQALEQADDHFDSRQVDAQVALQAADLPQLCDLFLAITQFPASLSPSIRPTARRWRIVPIPRWLAAAVSRSL